MRYQLEELMTTPPGVRLAPESTDQPESPPHSRRLEEILNIMIESLGSRYKMRNVDPLYSNVIHFGGSIEQEGGPEGVVDIAINVKKRPNEQVARREVDALNHWASLVGIKWEDFGFPLTLAGDRIIAPYIGPEVYQVIDELNKKIESSKGQERKSLEIFRRVFVLRQVDTLSYSIMDPYIPRNNRGEEITSNSDVVVYYITNLVSVLKRMTDEKYKRIKKAATVFKDLFDSSRKVRYFDTYARNICVAFHQPIGSLKADIDGLLELRRKYHAEHPDSSTIENDFAFLNPRLVQVDLHRNEKCALDVESLENIIRGSRLLDSSAPFDAHEQENAFARYMLQREYLREIGKGPSHRERATELSAEIDKTNEGNYTINELRKYIQFDEKAERHYLAMKLYKAIRWTGYIRDHYIERYEQAVEGEPLGIAEQVRKYRLALYKKDLEVHQAVARQTMDELLEKLFDILPGEVTKEIDYKEEKYTVAKTEEGYVLKWYSKNRMVKSFKTDSAFRPLLYERLCQLSTSKVKDEDPKQLSAPKQLSMFLKLAYLSTFLK